MSYRCQYEAITVFRKQESMPSLEFRIDFDESLIELLVNVNVPFSSASDGWKMMEELRMDVLHVYLPVC